jgi:hypothetical protein
MVFSHWTIIHCLFTYMNCMYRSQLHIWRVWRYQRGHQNAYMEDEQTTQWSKEKMQRDKLRSTSHTYIMTHILFYILWHMSYATKCIYIYHTIISYAIYYMTHVLCYILYDTCFMLYIYDSNYWFSVQHIQQNNKSITMWLLFK